MKRNPNVSQHKVQLIFMLLVLSIGSTLKAQTITKKTDPVVAGTVCPDVTLYSVSIPTNIGACKITWEATNGSINGRNDLKDVSVTWKDTPGATAILKVTFSGCESGNPNEGVSSSLSELILSVKGQAFSSSNSPVNVDYCNTKTVNIYVPHMWVQGTGGIAQPPLQEVVYSWTLPPGWYADGNVYNTSINGITIHPTSCAVPGTGGGRHQRPVRLGRGFGPLQYIVVGF